MEETSLLECYYVTVCGRWMFFLKGFHCVVRVTQDIPFFSPFPEWVATLHTPACPQWLCPYVESSFCTLTTFVLSETRLWSDHSEHVLSQARWCVCSGLSRLKKRGVFTAATNRNDLNTVCSLIPLS